MLHSHSYRLRMAEMLTNRVIYYLSIWYTRRELATRVGIFYAALVSSSAFGGLLAYGMFHITSGPYHPWSYLFFMEGGLTMLWSLLLYALLPMNTQSAWFLTQQERDVAALRLMQDSVSNVRMPFSWKEAFSEFYTPHGYIRVLWAFVSGIILTSNANFLAMVVKRLGYSTVKTNLVSTFNPSGNPLALRSCLGHASTPQHDAHTNKPVHRRPCAHWSRLPDRMVQKLRPVPRARPAHHGVHVPQSHRVHLARDHSNHQHTRAVLCHVPLHHWRKCFSRMGHWLIIRLTPLTFSAQPGP